MGEQDNVDLVRGSYRMFGNDDLVKLLKAKFGTVDELECSPEEFIASGDHVVALGRERIRVQRSGRILEWKFAHVWTLRNGSIVDLREFFSAGAGADGS